ncbi:hypothetical protein ANANG_G00173000 [Anguilla anguilla]|uniref:Uncharacterized protein n=1 Tax=Anguilla anguilla TaxID=7936 RepID=A0A9D3M3T5_ANGAN|nr:hypothetical protein ANANG_G00173000 [Anguilla anguilla]
MENCSFASVVLVCGKLCWMYLRLDTGRSRLQLFTQLCQLNHGLFKRFPDMTSWCGVLGKELGLQPNGCRFRAQNWELNLSFLCTLFNDTLTALENVQLQW